MCNNYYSSMCVFLSPFYSYGNGPGVDVVLIQPLQLCCVHVNHVVLMLTNISLAYVHFHKKTKEVCVKSRSTSALHSFEGRGTNPTTLKWSIITWSIITARTKNP